METQNLSDFVNDRRQKRAGELSGKTTDELLYMVIKLEEKNVLLSEKAERSEKEVALEAVKLAKKYDHSTIDVTDLDYQEMVERK